MAAAGVRFENRHSGMRPVCTASSAFHHLPSLPCNAPPKVALLNPQAKKDAPRFRALVLIGVAAAFCDAIINPHMLKPSVASKLVEINHPDACPPQWLPVLLASSSSHIDSPAPRFDEEDLPFEALSMERRMTEVAPAHLYHSG